MHTSYFHTSQPKLKACRHSRRGRSTMKAFVLSFLRAGTRNRLCLLVHREVLSPFCQDTAYGRDLREKAIRGETAAAAGTVPTQSWPVVDSGKVRGMTTRAWRWLTTRARGEFRRAVRGIYMSNGSAPGKSGLSYAELKCMSDDMLDLLSDLCDISVVSGVVFSDWCEEIVYMIPKESGVDLLENLRT
jgi:hypothetical protein